jgi:flagellar biosynthesis/type III secretory pathway protein FliH
MATVSSKVIKKYNKKLLKPFIFSAFQRSERISNKMEFPDFSAELSKEENLGSSSKGTIIKEKDRGTKDITLDKAFEELGNKLKENSTKDNKEENDKNTLEERNTKGKEENKETEENDRETKEMLIDKEFEELGSKLKNDNIEEDNEKKEKINDLSNNNEFRIDENGNLKESKENLKSKESFSVPMIEESRHLEILEAERNKYRKIGYKEGYEKALMEAKEKFLREYEAKKEDYLESLASGFSDAIGEIKKIRDILLDLDKNLPKIVLNFVRRIVGLERKINDKIIISVIRSKIEKIKALEDIKFFVNPDDLEYVKYEFPGYNVEADPNIMKGSFRVKTKIGELIFDLDRMIDNLEEIIYEELKVTESN